MKLFQSCENNFGPGSLPIRIVGVCDEEDKMAIPKMPLKAWLQIALIILAFFATLIFSHHLWSTGSRRMAVAPLFFYTAVVTLYSAYMTYRRKV
jgi:hypothetical protein